VLKIPSALTDAGMGQITKTMAYDNLKKIDVYNSGGETRRSEIVREATNCQELYTGLYLYLNCPDFFYLEDFVGGIGNMLLEFRLLCSPGIFETMPREAKKRKSSSTYALDSLVVEVSESRPFSSNFVRLALVVVCPSASLAGL